LNGYFEKLKGLTQILKRREKKKEKEKRPSTPNWSYVEYTHHLGMEGPPRRFQCYLGRWCLASGHCRTRRLKCTSTTNTLMPAMHALTIF